MNRILLVGLGFVIISIACLVSLPFIFTGVAQTDISTRHANPSVLWGIQPISVTLDIVPTLLPTCSRTIIPMDIVLLLDGSSSMAGQPWQNVINATKSFYQNIDLKVHRVAVIVFDDSAHRLIEFGTVLNQQVDGFEPIGNTSIEAGLQEAQSILLNSTNSKVVLLLSDGQGNPESATMAANMKAKFGIKIITIGFNLAESDYNDPNNQAAQLLKEISSPNAPRAASNPSTLPQIYEDLALLINNAIATDVKVTENYNTTAFNLAKGVNNSNPAELSWVYPTMPESGLQQVYQVKPKNFGLYALTTASAEVKLKYCNQPYTFAQPSGPYIVVLPEPTFLFLLFFLLLPFLFWLWWRGRDKPRIASHDPGKPSLVKPEYATWYKPQWLGNFNDLLHLPQQQSLSTDSLAETVIIGLGAEGFEPLERLCIDLTERFGTAYQTKIRLLHIDVQPQSSEKGNPTGVVVTALSAQQKVVLTPNYVNVDAILQKSRVEQDQKYNHWQWWQGNNATQYGRAAGRMAIFDDLKNGTRSSILWHRLEEAFDGLRQPNIWLVTPSFDNFGSGMLVDVARLCQLVRGRTDRVSVILSLPNEKIGEQDFEAKPKSWATLRELERLMRNLPVQYIYNPHLHERHLEETLQGSVLGDILVFDPTVNPTLETESHLSIASFLLAMSEHNVQHEFNQRFIAARGWAGTLANQGRQINQQRKFVSTVASMGAYTLHVPMLALQKLVEWLLVHELLFGVETGLVKNYQLDAEYRSLPKTMAGTSLNSTQEVTQFLQTLDIDPDRLHNLSVKEQERFYQKFGPALLNQVLVGLNGTSSEQEKMVAYRSGRLSEVIQLLQELIRKLESIKSTEIGKPAYDLTKQLETQIVSWLEQLRGKTTSSLLSSVPKAPMWEAWHEKYQVALNHYLILEREKARHNFVELGFLDRSYIQRMLQRVGWCWQKQGEQWQLRLIILPPTVTIDPHNDYPLQTYSYQAQNMADILTNLHLIASCFSKSVVEQIYTTNIGTYLTNLIEDDPNAMNKWLQASQPACKLAPGEDIQALTGQAVVEGLFAVLQDAPTLDKLVVEISHSQQQIKPTAVLLPSDPYSCHIIQAKYLLPLQAVVYGHSHWRGSYRSDKTLHVWSAEQLAVQQETVQQKTVQQKTLETRFRPEFVALLDNSTKAELFGLAIIYGLVTNSAPFSLKDKQTIIFDSPHAESWVEFMRVFMETTLSSESEKKLIEVIADRRAMIAQDKRTHLNTIKGKTITPLLQHPDYNMQSLARWLDYLLAKE